MGAARMDSFPRRDVEAFFFIVASELYVSVGCAD